MKKRYILVIGLVMGFAISRCGIGFESSVVISPSPATQGAGGHTPSGTYVSSGYFVEISQSLGDLGCITVPEFGSLVGGFEVGAGAEANEGQTVTLRVASDSSVAIPAGIKLIGSTGSIDYDPNFTPEFVEGSTKITFSTTKIESVRVLVFPPDGNLLFQLVCGIPEETVETPPAETPSPTPNFANSDVCNKVRNSVSDELAQAVDLYNSYGISLADLGRIYGYWAELNQAVLGTTSGAVKSALKTLISHAKSISAAARNGDDYTAANYIVKFSDALGPMDSACR